MDEHRNAAGSHDAMCAVQRWGGLVAGSALAIYGLTRRSKKGMALAATGGLLAYRVTRAKRRHHEHDTRSVVTVNAPPEQLYQFWQELENLPLFMRHLESVTQLPNGNSRWTALTPAGRIQWEAEVVDRKENESISWRCVPGSDLYMEGSVHFRKAPANRGTLVEANIRYAPVKGPLRSTVQKMFGKYPSFIITQDLRRFKALIETGEIPTTEGQPHGPRSRVLGAARLANPDKPMPPESKITELYDARRRAS
jgi:uncharacterized membrane protein